MKETGKAYKITAWVLGIIVYLFIFGIVTKAYLFSNIYIDMEIPAKTVCKQSVKQINLTITLKNKTNGNIDSEQNYFLSYHLMDLKGNIIKFDNMRTSLPVITSGSSKDIQMSVEVPQKSGEYQIEADVVKEGEFWYKDKGNKTSVGKLVVE